MTDLNIGRNTESQTNRIDITTDKLTYTTVKNDKQADRIIERMT